MSVWKRIVAVGLPVVLTTGVVLAAPMALAPGDAAPRIMGYDLDGRLEEVKWDGGITLVNFWATWCEPCREEMPVLQELQDKYADDGLRVIGMNAEAIAPDEVRKFLEDLKISYPIRTPHKRFKWDGIGILPTSFLVDGKGTILRRYVGARPEQLEGLKRDVDDVIHGRTMQPIVIPTDEPGDPGKRAVY